MIPLRDDVDSKSWPVVNLALIGTNIYFFVQELKFQNVGQLEGLIHHFAVVPTLLFSNFPQYAYTLVSAAFLHGGWMHIIGNMWFLYIFGDNVEDRMGHFRYLFFYLFVGVAANGIQAFMAPASHLPLIGASGAIAGVLGAYFFYYPHARVLTLLPIGIFSTIREIPAFFFLGFWFVLQALNGTFSMRFAAQQSMGGVAWWAHASGFIAGLLASPMLDQKRRGR